jgi:superfamily II DNA/RNA helicase
MSFSDLGLSEKVREAVATTGYSEATPIQAQAIPHILARRDVLGLAQTGTGKTAAFTLPMLTLLESGRARARMPRTLILEPTRELAAQVEESFTRYGVNHRLNVALLIGGVSFGDQDAKITRGVDVLIATPGRLLDHFERGKLLLSGVELLVIDEADRMLDMGFIPDIERIVKMVPFTRQTLFFSATMPPEITRLADQFLHNPVRIEVARPASAAQTITQRLVATHSDASSKRETLRRLIRDAVDLQNGIIFCNRKRDVAVVHKSLEKHGFKAVALHGDMDQRARMQALEAFRSGEMRLLVASDVAARGLDIPAVSHVFNYDISFHPDDYVHRIGRTGRAGRLGSAYTLIAPGDEKSLAAVEALIHQTLDWDGPDLANLPESSPHSSSERSSPRSSSSRREGGRSSSRRDEQEEPSRGNRAPRSRHRREDSPVSAGASRLQERHSPVHDPSQEPKTPISSPQRSSYPERTGYRPSLSEPPSPPGLGDHVPAFLMRPFRKN